MQKDASNAATRTRASAIRLWSGIAVGVVATGIVATTVRVHQLKTAPDERLVRAMVRPSGQLVQQRSVAEPEPRGRIVDRMGRLLALDTVGGRLFIDVRDLYTDALDRIERAERRGAAADGASLDPLSDLAVALSRPLGMSPADILRPVLERVPVDLHTLRRDMSDDDWRRLPRFVVVAEDLDDAQAGAVSEAQRAQGPRGILRGAHVQSKSVRVRPFEDLAAALVGRTGADGKGQSGAEFRADARLGSEPGRSVYLVDNRGQVISRTDMGEFAGAPGDEVRLSIDAVIQEIVEREIDEVVERANAGGGRCLVVDADNGEILAAYDTLRGSTGRSAIAKDPLRAHDPSLGRLRWVTDPFEPGSIFKPFVWAWAVELGKARSSEIIRLPEGPLVLSDGRARRTIREAHPSSYGTRSWHDCLTKSVNAGMATVAMRMSAADMQECLSRFGFGRRTSLGLPGESPGLLPPKDEWTNRTRALASVSFGQGVAVTPLQLMQAFTAFCRDGSMTPLAMTPSAPGGLGGTMPVLGQRALRETREAMQDVITQGTGKKLKDILRFTGFGKSGTAQLVREQGGYYDDRYIVSFIMGAPFEDTRIAVLVTIEDPDKVKLKGQYGGGSLAGPVAARIVNGALDYLGVPNDGTLVYSDKKQAPRLAQAE
jgi:cell division protein FtsI (penicillin-binding protein 3)